MSNTTVSVRVWGDFACFTRPEMKVERVSYPVMTPSAARGVLEAIFWEPEVYYLVDAVRVVKKGIWLSIRRNEVTQVISMGNAQKWMKDSAKFRPILAGGGAPDAAQRNMLALADVEYIITAEMAVSELGRRAEQKLKKYIHEFQRRAELGKCFHRPAMGMREFSCDFEWEADPQAALERRATEIHDNLAWHNIWPREDLGLMLYDVFDHDLRRIGFRWLDAPGQEYSRQPVPPPGSTQPKSRPKPGRRRRTPLRYAGQKISPQAYFFDAKIRNSILECHPDRVSLVRRQLQEG